MLPAISIETQVDLNFGKYERFEAQFYLGSRLVHALGFYDKAAKHIEYFPRVAESNVGKQFCRSAVGYAQELQGIVHISAMDEGTTIQTSRLGMDIERRTPILVKYEKKTWKEKAMGYFSEAIDDQLIFYTRLENGMFAGERDIIYTNTIDKVCKLRKNPRLHFGEDQLSPIIEEEDLAHLGRS